MVCSVGIILNDGSSSLGSPVLSEVRGTNQETEVCLLSPELSFTVQLLSRVRLFVTL